MENVWLASVWVVCGVVALWVAATRLDPRESWTLGMLARDVVCFALFGPVGLLVALGCLVSDWSGWDRPINFFRPSTRDHTKRVVAGQQPAEKYLAEAEREVEELLR